MIIPLVIKDSDMQISMLKQMMKIIQDGELLKKIRDSKDRSEILDCLKILED